MYIEFEHTSTFVAFKMRKYTERQAKSCLPFVFYKRFSLSALFTIFICIFYIKRGEEKMKNTTCKICIPAILLNLLLFLTKLYVGLSSNSISIYSDSVNNLFDSLSAALSLVFLLYALKGNSFCSKALYERVQYLLSFCLCVIVFITGAVFLYSSFERLMYPTPIWYTDKYFYILCATAICKIGMYLLYKCISKNDASPVSTVMAFDCILDFFVTGVTILGLVVSKYEFYAADSFCGIIVSSILIFGAIKLLRSNLANLLGLSSKADRDTLDSILFENEYAEKVKSLSFSQNEGIITVYINIELERDKSEKLIKEIEESTRFKAVVNNL